MASTSFWKELYDMDPAQLEEVICEATKVKEDLEAEAECLEDWNKVREAMRDFCFKHDMVISFLVSGMVDENTAKEFWYDGFDLNSIFGAPGVIELGEG
jgi:hypothetical protein